MPTDLAWKKTHVRRNMNFISNFVFKLLRSILSKNYSYYYWFSLHFQKPVEVQSLSKAVPQSLQCDEILYMYLIITEKFRKHNYDTTTLTSKICSKYHINDSASLANFEQILHIVVKLIATNVFGRAEVSLSLRFPMTESFLLSCNRFM